MEPTSKALSGPSPQQVFKRYLLAVRPMFLTASVLPVLLGTAWGVHVAGSADWSSFVLAVLSIALVHAGINVLNDVYDDLNGTDRINDERIFPYTGGSRFIQNEILNVRQMRRWSYLLLAAAGVTGAILFFSKGPMILVFGLAGIVLGTLYSMPPLQLSARGLGELAVGLGFGLLPVVGAAWLQSGQFEWGAVILSIPVSAWVANILLANELPDIPADGRVGKRTLAVRLGYPGVGLVYGLLTIFALAAILGAILYASLSPWILVLPLVVCALGLYVSRGIARTRQAQDLKPLIEMTLTIHAVGTLWLAAWIVWS
ncbi:MAG: prenyltransferase [Thiohalophilus sp.]|jgi:1,4-dihydroxy-2-naphthoate octaprenyltransferase